MKNQRIWAAVGLVLIVGSFVCMMAGMFAADAKALLMDVSMIGFLGAAGILLALSVLRRKAQEDEHKEEE